MVIMSAFIHLHVYEGLSMANKACRPPQSTLPMMTLAPDLSPCGQVPNGIVFSGDLPSDTSMFFCSHYGGLVSYPFLGHVSTV